MLFKEDSGDAFRAAQKTLDLKCMCQLFALFDQNMLYLIKIFYLGSNQNKEWAAEEKKHRYQGFIRTPGEIRGKREQQFITV